MQSTKSCNGRKHLWPPVLSLGILDYLVDGALWSPHPENARVLQQQLLCRAFVEGQVLPILICSKIEESGAKATQDIPEVFGQERPQEILGSKVHPRGHPARLLVVPFVLA